MATIESRAENHLLDEAELATICGGSIVDVILKLAGALTPHETAKGMIQSIGR
jgi:hypothetical protein